MQQGSVVGLSNAQGLGFPGQFPQSPSSPIVSWAQSLGHREENLKPFYSLVPMKNEAFNAGIVSSRETVGSEWLSFANVVDPVWILNTLS